MKRYTDETLALIDTEVHAQAGQHYDALKSEFVDFHNDLRTASPVELMQLGLSSESAHNILYFLQQINAGMDPTCKQKVTMSRMKEDEAPLFAVEA